MPKFPAAAWRSGSSRGPSISEAIVLPAATYLVLLSIALRIETIGPSPPRKQIWLLLFPGTSELLEALLRGRAVQIGNLADPGRNPTEGQRRERAQQMHAADGAQAIGQPLEQPE